MFHGIVIDTEYQRTFIHAHLNFLRRNIEEFYLLNELFFQDYPMFKRRNIKKPEHFVEPKSVLECFDALLELVENQERKDTIWCNLILSFFYQQYMLGVSVKERNRALVMLGINRRLTRKKPCPKCNSSNHSLPTSPNCPFQYSEFK